MSNLDPNQKRKRQLSLKGVVVTAEGLRKLRAQYLGTREKADALAVLCLTVSIFLPFYVTTAVCSVLAVVTMIDYERRQKAFASLYTRVLLGFLLVPFFVAAMYNNLWGLLVSLILYAVVICGFYVRSVMTRALFAKALDAACLCSVGCAAAALAQKLWMLPVAPEYRPVSTFSNANYYGAVVELMLLVCLYRCFTNRPTRRWYLAAAGANLLGLYLTASLSSAAAACFGVLVFLALQHRRRLALFVVLAAGACALLALCFPVLFPRVESIDVAWGQRFSIWKTSLLGILEHPLLGQGAAAYRIVGPKYGGYITFHSHNLLLDGLLNFGLIGMGVFAFYGFTQARLLRLRFQNNIGRSVNVLTFSATAAVLAHGVTDVTIFWVQTAMLYLLLISSLSMGASFLERELEPQRPAFVPGSLTSAY